MMMDAVVTKCIIRKPGEPEGNIVYGIVMVRKPKKQLKGRMLETCIMPAYVDCMHWH